MKKLDRKKKGNESSYFVCLGWSSDQILLVFQLAGFEGDMFGPYV